MITIATLLWQPNVTSFPFSRAYDQSWVEKLYRGFARNLTQPFEFVVFTDRQRSFDEPINQMTLTDNPPSYGSCIEPFRLGIPMIIVGLDTIVCGNVDHLAEYCMTADKIALPRDPYHPHIACNGVALVPAGNEDVWPGTAPENDMAHVRTTEHVYIDDLFPLQVISYKAHWRGQDRPNARIVYFHGGSKPHQLPDEPLVQKHWL